MKSLQVDNGAKSPIVSGLTTGGLKYQDNISLVTIVAGITAIGLEIVISDSGTSSKIGCEVTTSEVEGGVKTFQASI